MIAREIFSIKHRF